MAFLFWNTQEILEVVLLRIECAATDMQEEYYQYQEKGSGEDL
jgi:hypothetical protein